MTKMCKNSPEELFNFSNNEMLKKCALRQSAADQHVLINKMATVQMDKLVYNNEIMAIKKEVRKLKDIIETMTEKLCELEKGAEKFKKGQTDQVHEEEESPKDLGRNDHESPQKEPQKTHQYNSYCCDGTRTKILWLHCEICTYKSKSGNTLKKHTASKHKNLQKCTICEKQFEYETSLEDHTNKDHNTTSLNTKSLEQIEVTECSDDESDVSIDEERMEALDREMNPGDYI